MGERRQRSSPIRHGRDPLGQSCSPRLRQGRGGLAPCPDGGGGSPREPKIGNVVGRQIVKFGQRTDSVGTAAKCADLNPRNVVKRGTMVAVVIPAWP